MPKKLTRETLVSVAKTFCLDQSKIAHTELFGVTDGKAVGTYVEHLFQALILERFGVRSFRLVETKSFCDQDQGFSG